MIFDFLYSLIIHPLYQIVEFFYTLCDGVTDNHALAVIGVSLTVSLLCLPLYVIAEKWQDAERQKQEEMKERLSRIKKAFSGDERYMITSAYYRQCGYKPIMALRSSLSIAIQIPFFIAAYRFLSHLEALNGFSFLFIKDMSQPDALFRIGNFNVNILPIAMTLINVTSGAVYTKGHPLREKLQVYLMALFFLVFLYNSPSGLVFYWTMNNIFSLVKNIFYKFKKPLLALYICAAAAVLATDWFLLFRHDGFFFRRAILAAALSTVLFIPLLLKLLNFILEKPLKDFTGDRKSVTKLFFTSASVLCVLTGLAIPSFIISSSPAEFSFIDGYSSPFYFLFHTFFQSLGFCIFWPSCIFFLFNNKVRSAETLLFSLIALCGLSNAFIFGGDYGTISSVLTFTNAGTLMPSKTFAAISLAVCVIILALILILCSRKKLTVILTTLTFATFIALSAISVVNSAKIKSGYKHTAELRTAMEDSIKKSDGITSVDSKKDDFSAQNPQINPAFHLSKTGRNVLVIFLDRAIGGFFSYMMEEDSSLEEKFSGFTYYPNTVSFGGLTLTGSPPVYGGYEYTPQNMNKRKDEALVDKHNEALKMLPVLFMQNGFVSTVTDLSWANYDWIPDLRIFDDFPEIRREPTMRVYNDVWLSSHPEFTKLVSVSESLKRNFIWLSFFKIMPPLARQTIYDEGSWWSPKSENDGVQAYLNSYSVMDLLPELTDFTSQKDTFTILVNECPHEPLMLNYPNYTLEDTQNTGPYPLDSDPHYNSTFGAIKRLEEFFDYLKENNVYDNTRIIIVADHGGGSGLDELIPQQKNDTVSAIVYNPLLLFKDFNADGGIKTSYEFMTNADTPILAAKGLVEKLENPFTHKNLEEQVQKSPAKIAIFTYWSPDGQNKNTFNIQGWAEVHDDIFEGSNWSRAEED